MHEDQRPNHSQRPAPPGGTHPYYGSAQPAEPQSAPQSAPHYAPQSPNHPGAGYQQPPQGQYAAYPQEQPYPPQQPYAQGVHDPHAYWQQREINSESMLAHLLSVLIGPIASIVYYICKRNAHPTVRAHAAEALNLDLSCVAAVFGLFVMMMSMSAMNNMGMFMLCASGIFALSAYRLIAGIIACVKANSGKPVRYTFCVHLFK